MVNHVYPFSLRHRKEEICQENHHGLEKDLEKNLKNLKKNQLLQKKKQLKKYELYKRGLDVSFKSGGVASGMRRFNRGGKV